MLEIKLLILTLIILYQKTNCTNNTVSAQNHLQSNFRTLQGWTKSMYCGNFRHRYIRSLGFEPRLSRPQREVLTTIRRPSDTSGIWTHARRLVPKTSALDHSAIVSDAMGQHCISVHMHHLSLQKKVQLGKAQAGFRPLSHYLARPCPNKQILWFPFFM